MILKDKDLSKYQNKLILVDGCFDPIHAGHIDYFRFSAGLGHPLLCNLENDCYIRDFKKREPFLPEKQRLVILDSIKFINFVHLQTAATYSVLNNLKPLIFVKGADWKKKKLPSDELKICQRIGIKIIYMKKNLDSSTRILEKYNFNLNKK